MKYGIGLGLFHGISTMEAQDRMHILVCKLKASCLLLDGHGSEDFSMHAVVSDVAISVAASRDHNVSSQWLDEPMMLWLNSNKHQ